VKERGGGYDMRDPGGSKRRNDRKTKWVQEKS